MNIITVEHLSKAYGERVIYEDVSLGFDAQMKVGIVGANGSGKSTFLKILSGREEPDSGRVVTQKNLRFSCLDQDLAADGDIKVLDYVLAGLWQRDEAQQAMARAMMNELKLPGDALLSDLSGGMHKRADLVRSLLNPADVLLLDEPTNHLDQGMLSWLEEEIRSFKGCVIVITHDRYFLDRVCDHILEISRGKVYSYGAGYSGFLDLKAQRDEQERASERKRQSLLRMELEWARRGCRARSTKQKARLDRLEELKCASGPVKENALSLESVSARMGKKTIELKGVSKSFGDRCLFKDFSLLLPKGARIGIIGPNGCGKSTLLRLIGGEVQPDTGSREQGETIRIGFFEQTLPKMDLRGRVIDYIREEAEYIRVPGGVISASQMLERFLFDGETQYTSLSRLSGGERRRLYLCRVLMQAPNVLLLDEPGNDLDIPTLTILEDYLSSFSGIVVAVSHDRYFLDTVADQILSFEEGEIVSYLGGYSDSLAARENKDKEKGTGSASPEGTEGEQKGAAKSWVGPKKEKLRFSYKEEKEYERIDSEIEDLENALALLDEQIEKNASNAVELTRLMGEREKSQAALDEKMERWVYLNDLAERIEKGGH